MEFNSGFKGLKTLAVIQARTNNMGSPTRGPPVCIRRFGIPHYVIPTCAALCYKNVGRPFVAEH